MATRRIIRTARISTFKVGQRVIIDGGASGDIEGVVTETVDQLTKTISARNPSLATKPGIVARAYRWDGQEYSVADNLLVEAWDAETRLDPKFN